LRKAAPKPNEIVQTDEGLLVVPSNEEPDPETEGDAGRAHTEIQYLLLRLGADMGFDVHVARNDQSSTWRGQSLSEVPRRRHTLPQQFDPVTNQTIERIDVLWLDRNAIVAAFEIESTTSVYSGLLRMSDLLSRQPNISVPLFLVAPEERRSKVIREVNRPTFERMDPPLVDVCRYISFDVFREALERVREHVRYLKPEWLQAISESCAIDEV
jgi:hypothetical protein